MSLTRCTGVLKLYAHCVAHVNNGNRERQRRVGSTVDLEMASMPCLCTWLYQSSMNLPNMVPMLPARHGLRIRWRTTLMLYSAKRLMALAFPASHFSNPHLCLLLCEAV